MLCSSLGGVLRADGIALSHDGVTWFAGSGVFGEGWGDVGKGISVPSGATFYAKYYSEAQAELVLHYAPHGTKWGSWHTAGPTLTGNIGNSAASPVILKFQNVGTPSSTVTWMNGSGTWAGIIFPGSYDLALRHDAIWTLPPVTITPPAAQSRSWWRSVFGSSSARSTSGPTSVPDGGGTVLLLGLALLMGAALWYFLNHRRLRAQHSNNQSKD
jgi:hypothetical protein